MQVLPVCQSNVPVNDADTGRSEVPGYKSIQRVVITGAVPVQLIQTDSRMIMVTIDCK